MLAAGNARLIYRTDRREDLRDHIGDEVTEAPEAVRTEGWGSKSPGPVKNSPPPVRTPAPIKLT